MADRSNFEEGYPTLTAHEHWGRYAAGMLTETVFILALTLIALGLAAVAIAIW